MKTLLLEGTQEQFEILYKNITLEDKDNNLIPYEVEIRVFLVNKYLYNEEPINTTNWTDEEFMVVSEEQGNVFSLSGFQNTLNNDSTFNLYNYVVRFINVKI